MRKPALTICLLLTSFPAFGAESTSSFSLAASLVQMFGSLSVVLGLIYLITHFSKRWMPGSGGFGRSVSNIRIVETRHLSPKKSLMLVEVAGEYLLLSNGTDGISLIKQIDMLEEIEVIEIVGDRSKRDLGAFQQKLDGLIGRLNPSSLMTMISRSEG